MTKPKILCVDDEEVGLRIRRLVLETQGYAVSTALDGDSALQLFRNESFDLVILDYAMPGKNGGQVAAEMRQIRPHSPIIILSAYVSLPDEDIQAADLYLTKGDSPPAFLRNIKKLLESGSPAGGKF